MGEEQPANTTATSAEGRSDNTVDFDIRKRPFRNIDLMLIGLLSMLDGATAILSLGFYKSSLDMAYIEWRTRLAINALRRGA